MMTMKRLTRVILLVDTAREYERGLLRGIAKYSQLNGPWTFLKKPVYYLQSSKTGLSLKQLRDFHADGIITCEGPLLEHVLDFSLPTIISPYKQTSFEHIPVILPDSDAIGRMGAKHLLAYGFRQFAFCGFEDLPWSKIRGRCFATTVQEAGYVCISDHRPITPQYHSGEKALHYLAKWLEDLPKPIGLMACNDDCSQQVVEACKISQLRIPEQIAILGVNDDPMICGLTNPPLSSIVLGTENAGYKAAELLDQMISGIAPTERVVTVQATHVVRRSSTDILAIEDVIVSQALHFIRTNIRELIQVGDVAEAVGLSSSALSRRFQRVLQRSVFQEITRMRIDLMTQMLLETDMSIDLIARRLGYQSADHIARYFQQQKHMSPRQYRALHKK